MGKRVRVNFGDVEEYDAVPEDVYQAVIEKIEYREAKEKGKAPYLNVEYTIAEGEFEGRKVWEVLSWSPKALFRMRDFFAAAGYGGWDDDDDHDLDIDEDSNLLIDPDLSGEAVELTIENEIYNKKEVNRVVAIEFIDPPGDEDDEEEEEEPAPKKKSTKAPAKKTTKKVVEEEADDEEEAEDDDSADDEDGDEDEEEEEEEEPAPKKKASATATKKTFRPTTSGAKKSTNKTGKKPAKRTFR